VLDLKQHDALKSSRVEVVSRSGLDLKKSSRLRNSSGSLRYEFAAACKLRANRCVVYNAWLLVWHGFLGVTRVIREALGLRTSDLRAREKVQ
jgi:hypothetical protein